MVRVEIFKTDEDANREPNRLQQIADYLSAGRTRSGQCRSPRTRPRECVAAQVALRVRKAESAHLAEDDALTREALDTRAPEAFLARALLLSNARHPMPEGTAESTREATRKQGLQAYKNAEAALKATLGAGSPSSRPGRMPTPSTPTATCCIERTPSQQPSRCGEPPWTSAPWAWTAWQRAP